MAAPNQKGVRGSHDSSITRRLGGCKGHYRRCAGHTGTVPSWTHAVCNRDQPARYSAAGG
jgi:hypothetical protein